MYSQGDAQPSTDEGTANRSLFTCLSKLEVVSFWTHLLQLSALGTVQQSPAGSYYDWELQPLSNLVVSLEANIEERGERQLLMQSERRLWAKTALQWPHLRRAKKRNLIKWLALSITTVHWDHWSTLILYISKIWFPHGHFAQAYWASAQQREASSTQAFHNFWVWAFTSFSFESLLTPKDAKNVLKFLRQEISCILPMLDLHAEPAYNHSKGPGRGRGRDPKPRIWASFILSANVWKTIKIGFQATDMVVPPGPKRCRSFDPTSWSRNFHKIDGFEWKILLKRMIWGYPHFSKAPYDFGSKPSSELGCGRVTHSQNGLPLHSKKSGRKLLMANCDFGLPLPKRDTSHSHRSRCCNCCERRQ